MRLPRARPGKIPGPDRAQRQALRAIAAEHQREAAALPDQQTRVQSAHYTAEAVRSGKRIRLAWACTRLRFGRRGLLGHALAGASGWYGYGPESAMRYALTEH